MNTIDRQIEELKSKLQAQEWQNIELEIVGAVSIKVLLNKPQYTFNKRTNYIQLYDTKTNIQIDIDIYTATQIDKEELEYKIVLDNSQMVIIKIILQTKINIQ